MSKKDRLENVQEAEKAAVESVNTAFKAEKSAKAQIEEDNKEQYKPKNIVKDGVSEKEIIIQTASGKTKRKSIKTTTYRNGVVKNRLRGVEIQ